MFRIAVIVAFFAAFAPVVAFAQGGDGRPEPAKRRSAKARDLQRPKTNRSAPKRKPHTSKPAVPALGSLSTVINESDSHVYLSSPSNPDLKLVFVTPRRQSSFWRMLPAGRYTLTFKKLGFFDEQRTIDVEARKLTKLKIDLRPQMAILSVGTNIGDAEIEIENVGKFTKPLRKVYIKPGRYRIGLARRGFLSQTIIADLTVPGREQSIYAVLQPLRIDSVLNEASELLLRGNPDRAAVLVSDVLLLNPSHSRANFIIGMVELKRGSEKTSTYFLKAIDGGGTVVLPMKAMFAGRLVNVDLTIDRDAVLFASDKHLELNFRISRQELEDVRRMNDTGETPYLLIKGKSDFFGKPIRPEIKLYFNAAGQSECASASGCLNEVDILYKFIDDYRMARSYDVSTSPPRSTF